MLYLGGRRKMQILFVKRNERDVLAIETHFLMDFSNIYNVYFERVECRVGSYL